MKRIALPLICLFFLLFLFYPLAALFEGAFFVQKETAGETSTVFSLEYFYFVFENPFYLECFRNSLLIAVWTTLSALTIALPLALCFMRFRFPAKTALSTLLLLPLVLPPFVGAIGLKQIFSRFGSFNLLLAQAGLVDLQHPPNWFGNGGFLGVVLLEVMHLYPIMFLSVQAALANIDPSLKEAAQNLGARDIRLFRTVILPLALPGVFAGSAIVFVSAFTDLGVPLMFNFHATVPTQIFNLVTQGENPIGYALVVMTLVFVALLFLVGKKIGGTQSDYAMMGRSAVQDATVELRGAKGWLLSLGLTVGILFSILPHFGVIVQSFSEKWFFSVLPSGYSTAFYHEIFTLDLTAVSIENSLKYACCSAALDFILGLTIAYLVARERFAGRNLLDIVAMLPLALPGLVLAFAYFVAFTRPPLNPDWFGLGPSDLGIYFFIESLNRTFLSFFDPRKNPFILLVIGYAIQRLPYIVRAVYAGFQQTSVTLEEASANLGARPWRTLLKISLPLVMANLIAGTLLTFSFSILDVSNGMILAQEDRFYPVTKAIYALIGRITPVAPSIACALGVLAMVLLGGTLFFASKVLGQKLGQLFKA